MRFLQSHKQVATLHPRKEVLQRHFFAGVLLLFRTSCTACSCLMERKCRFGVSAAAAGWIACLSTMIFDWEASRRMFSIEKSSSAVAVVVATNAAHSPAVLLVFLQTDLLTFVRQFAQLIPGKHCTIASYVAVCRNASYASWFLVRNDKAPSCCFSSMTTCA